MIFGLLLLAEVGLLFLLSRVVQRGLSGVLLHLTGSQRVATWVMAVLFLPGTLVHELSHLVVARLLLVRAGHLSLLPRIEADRVVMGSVLIPQTDRVRRLIIGVAPGIVGLAVIFELLWVAQGQGWWRMWPYVTVVAYVVFEIGNTLFSSSADMEGALGLVVFAALVGGVAYWLGFRPSVDWVGPLLDQYQSVLSQAVLFLLVPLVIDTVVGLGLWLLGRVFRVSFG